MFCVLVCDGDDGDEDDGGGGDEGDSDDGDGGDEGDVMMMMAVTPSLRGPSSRSNGLRHAVAARGWKGWRLSKVSHMGFVPTPPRPTEARTPGSLGSSPDSHTGVCSNTTPGRDPHGPYSSKGVLLETHSGKRKEGEESYWLSREWRQEWGLGITFADETGIEDWRSTRSLEKSHPKRCSWWVRYPQ